MNWQLITLLLLGILFLFRRTLSLFLMTQLMGAPISLSTLLSMKFRKIDFEKVARSYVTLRKANVDISVKDLEAAYLLKYDIENITRGLAMSKHRNIPLTFEQAKEADKKGINMAEEIKKVDEGKNTRQFTL